MDITRWSTPKSDWLYSWHLKMEKLHSFTKSKTWSWLWLCSDHQLLIAKLKLKLKKEGKITRPFRYCCCCCSVTKSCATLCNHMDCSTPGLPIRLTSPRGCPSSCPLNQSYHPPISSSVALFSFCLQYFPASGAFPISQLFPSAGQSIRASASASVLPMSIQGWFLLEVTGLISLQSKGLLRVFSSTTIQNYSDCH